MLVCLHNLLITTHRTVTGKVENPSTRKLGGTLTRHETNRTPKMYSIGPWNIILLDVAKLRAFARRDERPQRRPLRRRVHHQWPAHPRARNRLRCLETRWRNAGQNIYAKESAQTMTSLRSRTPWLHGLFRTVVMYSVERKSWDWMDRGVAGKKSCEGTWVDERNWDMKLGIVFVDPGLYRPHCFWVYLSIVLEDEATAGQTGNRRYDNNSISSWQLPHVSQPLRAPSVWREKNGITIPARLVRAIIL